MRIGFDIDGVLANFVPAYQDLVIKLDGRNLFEPDDVNNPPCWNWPEFRGYSGELMKRVWGKITESPNFWFALPVHHNNVSALWLVLQDLEFKHDVYFITSRPGYRAKRQTEAWLTKHLLYDPGITPTVLLASDKGAAAKALKLDVYLDDNLDNAKSVLRESPGTRMYLLNRSYNEGDARVVIRTPDTEGGIPTTVAEQRVARRVNSLAEMLDAELTNL